METSIDDGLTHYYSVGSMSGKTMCGKVPYPPPGQVGLLCTENVERVTCPGCKQVIENARNALLDLRRAQRATQRIRSRARRAPGQ